MNENEIYIHIGNRIREFRLAKGITQQELADKCDLEIPNLSRIENGRTNPTVKTLFIICKALEIHMRDLFTLL
ncbi:MAG: helix-turn-helix domain-containing protein [Candidatus Cryptobacteroides sp.]